MGKRVAIVGVGQWSENKMSGEHASNSTPQGLKIVKLFYEA
jgi:hypothetical protein